MANLPAATQEPTAPPAKCAPPQPRKAWGPFVLKEDDKLAFPAPPPGWDARRESIPQGTLATIEYDSNWANSKGGPTGWNPYGFGAGLVEIIEGYAIPSANDVPERDPKDWQFQCSNMDRPGPYSIRGAAKVSPIVTGLIPTTSPTLRPIVTIGSMLPRTRAAKTMVFSSRNSRCSSPRSLPRHR